MLKISQTYHNSYLQFGTTKTFCLVCKFISSAYKDVQTIKRGFQAGQQISAVSQIVHFMQLAWVVCSHWEKIKWVGQTLSIKQQSQIQLPSSTVVYFLLSLQTAKKQNNKHILISSKIMMLQKSATTNSGTQCEKNHNVVHHVKAKSLRSLSIKQPL